MLDENDDDGDDDDDEFPPLVEPDPVFAAEADPDETELDEEFLDDDCEALELLEDTEISELGSSMVPAVEP